MSDMSMLCYLRKQCLIVKDLWWMFSVNVGMPEASTEDKLIQRKYDTKGTFDCLKIFHHKKSLMIMLLVNESVVVISKIPFRSATRLFTNTHYWHYCQLFFPVYL